MSESGCKASKGQFCTVPSSCVANCAKCKTTTACGTCTAGYGKFGGKCASGSDVFSGSKSSIHVKENLVLLGNAEAFKALEDGYKGSSSRYEAIEMAVRGFLHHYKDVFDGVMVFPWKKLTGSTTHGQQWGGSNLRESGGRIASMITLQNYGPGYTIPLLHEVAHRWGVFVDGIGCCHWGMTAFDKHGMLGGFARDKMACKSGVFPNCNTNTLVWDFSAGSGQTSNDGIGKYSKYELLMMGLYSASELASEDPLVYCKGASKQWGSGKVEVTCSSIDKMTPAQVAAAISSATKKTQISKGTNLRYAAVVLFPSASAAATEAKAASFTKASDLEWLNTYIGGTPAKFSSATEQRATMSFTVSDSDKRSASGTSGTSGTTKSASGTSGTFGTTKSASGTSGTSGTIKRVSAGSGAGGGAGGGTTTTTTITTPSVLAVSTVVTLTGLDFDKVAANATVKATLVTNIKDAFLASMTGYTKDDLNVVLTKGSVKATVTITPKAGSDTAALKSLMTSQKVATESAVLTKVKAMPAVSSILENGQSLSDVVASSTAPMQVARTSTSGTTGGSTTGKKGSASKAGRPHGILQTIVVASVCIITTMLV